jgi:hypothetical protein
MIIRKLNGLHICLFSCALRNSIYTIIQNVFLLMKYGICPFQVKYFNCEKQVTADVILLSERGNKK